ncbi:zinc-dependent metalloprotease [Gillisia hiemivivida]|uniref:Zinc-dependent metalloprotease n=1 Tax=Gillisia hiemivivida TaxID=291190 RepID=A0A5C6ZTA9_9FLAO|nr:zinc-dependent metalloprotease [Gillisia hiemivivida]TXD93167.1 zinc-dependent metalloprotease [Gillisia hiemivivida]
MKPFLAIFLFLSITSSFYSQTSSDKENLQKYKGFFNFEYSEKEDKIFLEVKDLDTEFLYVHSLTTGIGSNDVGLDRGQLGNEAVVKFIKAGNKLLLIQPNLRYIAITENALEKKSVEEAFATSVLYGFEIKEKKGNTYIIDFTPFLMEDAHGVSDRLKSGNHGSFSLNKSKSALSLDRTKAFPENVEFEALLTFDGEATSQTLKEVLPNNNSITVTQHHSFVKLPDDKYKKRAFDPRSGAIYISYLDYSTPVFEPIEKRYITRHRLAKKDPSKEISEAVEPIIYYLDPGTPEPVKSALLDGARWWNEAYEAIGYKNAFQVKMLPEGADPLDVRYNVIQWVHRSTRGWSYGASVIDPRTGEIIKGHVSLGSLRIRQDFLIAQALLNKPFAENDKNHNKMMEMAIARIRQLSAHEVGHTLGFAHNFAASTNENSSVMDYPHPQFKLENDEIVVDDAYSIGVGAWDKITVKYSYADLPSEVNESDFLNGVLAEADDQKLRFITDSDARASGGANAFGHLWDNGSSPTEGLKDLLEIRKKAISNFSVDNIRTGEAYSTLEDVFVPLYFLHRYQTEAVSKVIGGLDYSYAVKGDTQKPVKTASVEDQRKALSVYLNTLNAEVLAIPKDKLELFPPRAYGFGRSRESFKSNTGVAFDAFGAAGTASVLSLQYLLHPERAARLIQQKTLDNSQLGLDEVLEELINSTLKKTFKDSYLQQVQNTINYNVLQYLFNLAVNKGSIPQVKAVTNSVINSLQSWLESNSNNEVFRSQLLREIEQFKKDPELFKPMIQAPEIPDGSPIGSYN